MRGAATPCDCPGAGLSNSDDFGVTEITRHFTATTFVVSGGRVLLHRHPKQGLWLPPGGHIERDELPHVAAVREVEEETGLKVRLHSETLAAAMSEEMECPVVPQPAFILVEDINPFHQHIDFTYYALVLPPTTRRMAARTGVANERIRLVLARTHLTGSTCRKMSA